tara:strand:+ start:98 stop:499 length:402 start_codon:yes stop_codon:yes gene_type:complete
MADQYLTTAWTDKQKRFVEEYLLDNNATQAAIRAGYSARTATKSSSKLMAKADIRNAIEARMTRIAEKIDITVAKVLEDLERVRGKAEAEDEFGNALRATELQGKYLKMFTDKIQQETEMHITVVTGVPERDE